MPSAASWRAASQQKRSCCRPPPFRRPQITQAQLLIISLRAFRSSTWGRAPPAEACENLRKSNRPLTVAQRMRHGLSGQRIAPAFGPCLGTLRCRSAAHREPVDQHPADAPGCLRCRRTIGTSPRTATPSRMEAAGSGTGLGPSPVNGGPAKGEAVKPLRVVDDCPETACREDDIARRG